MTTTIPIATGKQTSPNQIESEKAAFANTSTVETNFNPETGAASQKEDATDYLANCCEGVQEGFGRSYIEPGNHRFNEINKPVKKTIPIASMVVIGVLNILAVSLLVLFFLGLAPFEES